MAIYQLDHEKSYRYNYQNNYYTYTFGKIWIENSNRSTFEISFSKCYMDEDSIRLL